ncbi:MAG: O-methyltransferase [Bacteroidota bacterium]
MDFEALHDYAATHSTQESEELARIRRTTHLEVLKPRMLSGALQGAFLKLVVSMLQPKRILEIGTFTGYSALAMAEALPKEGHIHTIERNEELRARVKKNLHTVSDRVTTHWGHALDIIPKLEDDFDLVFIDADKTNYLNYYHLVFPKLKSGGWIMADNVLWSGKVLDPTAHKDKKTRALVEFNQTVHQEQAQGLHILLPLRDGLFVIQKR